MTRSPLALGTLVVLLTGCHAPQPEPTRPVATRPADPSAPQIERVISGLVPVVRVVGAPVLRYPLRERMAHFRTPGVTVAVADRGRIVWARGFGVTRVGTGDRVLPTTPFEAASISKMAAATAALRLVEQGVLELDVDINRYLGSWKVPESPFTATEKVTLRRLLSHSSGLGGHSVDSYKPGKPLPTLSEILDGKSPATTAPVRVEAVPGSGSRYSGGGTTVVQLALTEVTQRPFADLLRTLVLGPVGMHDSAFEQPLPPTLRARAAVGHDVDEKPIPATLYPQMAAAGLWSTPSDLLKWALEIARARAGQSRLLSAAMAKQMLTVQKGPFGLGPYLEDSGRRAFRFMHGGWNDGFHSEVIYFPETGQGAAVMVNGTSGRPLLREIIYAIAAEYAWPALAPTDITVVEVGAPATARLVGTYESPKPLVVSATVSLREGRLFLTSPQLGAPTEVVFTSPTQITSLETGDRLSVISDPDGKVTALKLGFLVLPRRAP